MADLIENANIASELIDNYRKVIERAARLIIIPDGTLSIGDNAFYAYTNLQSITIPNSVTSIGESAFRYCDGLRNITIPDTVTSLGVRAFEDCRYAVSLTIGSGVTRIPNDAFSGWKNYTGTLTIPNTITYLGNMAFRNWEKVTTISIGSGVTSTGYQTFQGAKELVTLNILCVNVSFGVYVFSENTKMENVSLPNGFNGAGLNLSPSTLYSRDTILSWLNALADRTGLTAYTLTMGATNLAKLTAEEIAIATSKNWNLA